MAPTCGFPTGSMPHFPLGKQQVSRRATHTGRLVQNRASGRGSMSRAQRQAFVIGAVVALTVTPHHVTSAATAKPPLHGRHWVAITGKPLGATAGALIFAKGGNAVDAACAMLAATTTMWDTLSWGGETQALVYNPKTGKVIAVNALGVAPTGATPAFFKSREMVAPPEF